jgi:hypothetical protein
VRGGVLHQCVDCGRRFVGALRHTRCDGCWRAGHERPPARDSSRYTQFVQNWVDTLETGSSAPSQHDVACGGDDPDPPIDPITIAVPTAPCCGIIPYGDVLTMGPCSALVAYLKARFLNQARNATSLVRMSEYGNRWLDQYYPQSTQEVRTAALGASVAVAFADSPLEATIRRYLRAPAVLTGVYRLDNVSQGLLVGPSGPNFLTRIWGFVRPVLPQWSPTMVSPPVAQQPYISAARVAALALVFGLAGRSHRIRACAAWTGRQLVGHCSSLLTGAAVLSVGQQLAGVGSALRQASSAGFS